MGFYSKFEKYLNNICSKNNFSRSVSVLLSTCFAGAVIGTSILPTMVGAIIGGILGIVGVFIYISLVSKKK